MREPVAQDAFTTLSLPLPPLAGKPDAVRAARGPAWQTVTVQSGQTLGAHLKQRLTDPLGIPDTSFYVPEAARQARIAMAVNSGLLVRKAVALRRSSPREQFLGRITDKAAGFHDRDMYVFVLDEAGRYLAFGGNPAKVGTRVQDIPGIAGDQLVYDIVTQAQQGPGWVEYDITNPASGRVQTKMSYVVKVDSLYLGCGVYKSVAQATA